MNTVLLIDTKTLSVVKHFIIVESLAAFLSFIAQSLSFQYQGNDAICPRILMRSANNTSTNC